VDTRGALVVPIRDIAGHLHSLEFITAVGDKRFLPRGEKGRHYHSIGVPSDQIIICEGYATGASIYEATGHAVAVAFDCSNIGSVAKALRQKFPATRIVVAADNDQWTGGNPGVAGAEAAAKDVGGHVVVPQFNDMSSKPTDFNDLHRLEGVDAVRLAFSSGGQSAERGDSCEHDIHQSVGGESAERNNTEQTAQRSVSAPEEGCEILDAVYAFIGRFVAYPSVAAHIAHTLWIAHTHFMECWESTPRLAFLSPEPGSGKTRAIEVTETLVPRPVESINATPAYLFRKVADPEGAPTILYDEIDTLFGPRARDNEELRGLINAGHRRGATAGRCVVRGKVIETEELPAYCAVALAGLGNLPDTIMSRSIVVRMRRRSPTEKVEPYRRINAPQGHRLRDQLSAWAPRVAHALHQAQPAMPDGVEDRNADVWEPLLAIADLVGGCWPERAREAAVALVMHEKTATPSLGVRLLADIRQVFGQQQEMGTEALLHALLRLEESPWAELKGKPLAPRDLARLLSPYDVAPKLIRTDGHVTRGYRRCDLTDAWSRYLPESSHSGSVTSVASVATDRPDTIRSTDATLATDVTHVMDDNGEVLM
jgi:hypothetical protein